MIINNNSRLKIDPSILWVQQSEYFILRYRDINENSQNILAKRIKQTAPQSKIRDQLKGPTVQEIRETLTEFNPIIFAEDMFRIRSSPRNFGHFQVTSISGYHYNMICQSIYKMTCIKRQLWPCEIKKILHTTSNNRNAISTLVSALSVEETQLQPNPIEIPEFGIEEIQNIRLRAESNGANQIPRRMRDQFIDNIDTTIDHLINDENVEQIFNN